MSNENEANEKAKKEFLQQAEQKGFTYRGKLDYKKLPEKNEQTIVDGVNVSKDNGTTFVPTFIAYDPQKKECMTVGVRAKNVAGTAPTSQALNDMTKARLYSSITKHVEIIVAGTDGQISSKDQKFLKDLAKTDGQEYELIKPDDTKG